MIKSALVKKIAELATASELVCKGKSVGERRSFLSSYIRSNGRASELREKASEDELHEVDLLVESFAQNRQFVAVYGQEAYERLFLRANSPDLAAALLRAVVGPPRLPLECINMYKEITKIVVKWAGGTPNSFGATHVFDASSLGQTVSRQRAAARASIIAAHGGEYVATEYYADGSFTEFRNNYHN